MKVVGANKRLKAKIRLYVAVADQMFTVSGLFNSSSTVSR